MQHINKKILFKPVTEFFFIFLLFDIYKNIDVNMNPSMIKSVPI